LVAQIITILVLVTINVLISLLRKYCYDHVDLWEEEDGDFVLTRPSIRDINNANKSILDNYVQKEICAANYYFILRNELFAINKAAGESWGSYIILIFQVPLFLGIEKALYEIGFTENTFFCYAIALAICVICFIAASIIYRKTLKLPSFRKNKAYFKQRFENIKHLEKKYDVSDEVALNSYIIAAHMQYLLSIENTMRNRKVARSIVGVVAAVIYLIVFRPFDNL